MQGGINHGYHVGGVFWVISFRIFVVIVLCFVVAIFDLVHDMEAIFHLP